MQENSTNAAHGLMLSSNLRLERGDSSRCSGMHEGRGWLTAFFLSYPFLSLYVRTYLRGVEGWLSDKI
jgi:hypothetical protein